MRNLTKFLDAARERVAKRAYDVSDRPLRPNGSLRAALRAHPTPVIAELKPRSPAEGALLRGPVLEHLAAYRAGKAAAISVLADATHFGGSPALVRQAHAVGLPVLFKDFVVDESQVACAAHCGASAVLLIERAFAGRPHEREALVAAAHDAGLEVLLETFDDADLASAANSAADLLGVNARDLDSLSVDTPGALALVRKAAGHRGDRPIVALSGIDGRSAYRAAREAGAAAALVGTALMRSPDPALALLALQRPLAKVCGLRTSQDVKAAAAAGADLVGFVVDSPGSPREVTVSAARALVGLGRRAGLRTVLVTRAASQDAILAAACAAAPHYVQSHGLRPTPALRAQLAAGGTLVLGVGTPQAPAPDACDGVVLDSLPEGGSGRAHSWAPAPPGLTLVAGGLGIGNVGEALAATGAWGADASSALESAPGQKDSARLAAFVQAVHAA